MKRARLASPEALPPATGAPAAHVRVVYVLVALLLCITPLVVTPGTKESFRLVKGLAAGWIGLASLLAALWGLRHVDGVSLVGVIGRPLARVLGPLALVVVAGGWFTLHPEHYRESAADFLIGASCAMAWSFTLDASSLKRLLVLGIMPACLVALLTLDQAFGLFHLLDGLRVEAPTPRLALTSTLGNPGDVGAFLVLPILVALAIWPRTNDLQTGSRHRPASPRPRNRAALAAAILTMGAALVATRTLAAIASLVVAVPVLWWWRTGRQWHTRTAMKVAAGVLATAVLCLAFIAPVRMRVTAVADALGRGDVNAALTGRLDGWRAAARMTRDHPLTGVGQGAYRAEYADTRLALSGEGVRFFDEQTQVMFATPHNEILSVAAELGVPGILALAWAIVAMLGLAVRAGSALAWSGLSAVALLAVVWFPFHVAAVAWPWLLFMAWVAREAEEAQA